MYLLYISFSNTRISLSNTRANKLCLSHLRHIVHCSKIEIRNKNNKMCFKINPSHTHFSGYFNGTLISNSIQVPLCNTVGTRLTMLYLIEVSTKPTQEFSIN